MDHTPLFPDFNNALICSSWHQPKPTRLPPNQKSQLLHLHLESVYVHLRLSPHLVLLLLLLLMQWLLVMAVAVRLLWLYWQRYTGMVWYGTLLFLYRVWGRYGSHWLEGREGDGKTARDSINGTGSWCGHGGGRSPCVIPEPR